MVLASFRLSSALSQAASTEFTGRATVIDGHTFGIQGQRMWLNGVDAPESWQVCKDGAGGDYRCGKEAAAALDVFLSKSRPTTCIELDRDR